jgi:two-component system chemotaxis response regulator CheY
MKIMVVDDSGTMRTIQKRCLNKLNVTEILEAENGQQAFDLYEQNELDVILCDWNMPVMDGITFLRKLRAINKNIPFIMITTEAERSRVVEAIQSGVSDYLVKPFTQDALKDKLVKWVGNFSI